MVLVGHMNTTEGALESTIPKDDMGQNLGGRDNYGG